MNTKPIQFSRQGVLALLLVSLILAVAASLAWTGADASGSTFQPVQMVRGGAYSLQPGYPGPSAAAVDCTRADFWVRESEFLSPSWHWFLKRSKPGLGIGIGKRADSLGCESGLLPSSQLMSVKGSKPGIGAGNGGN